MRKITQEASQAFNNKYKYKKANTEVQTDGMTSKMYLHGHCIAKTEYNDLKDIYPVLSITLAGWNTNTTRERLNGLPGVRVSTKKGQAYLNGKEWNGEWVTI